MQATKKKPRKKPAAKRPANRPCAPQTKASGNGPCAPQTKASGNGPCAPQTKASGNGAGPSNAALFLKLLKGADDSMVSQFDAEIASIDAQIDVLKRERAGLAGARKTIFMRLHGREQMKKQDWPERVERIAAFLTAEGPASQAAIAEATRLSVSMVKTVFERSDRFVQQSRSRWDLAETPSVGPSQAPAGQTETPAALLHEAASKIREYLEKEFVADVSAIAKGIGCGKFVTLKGLESSDEFVCEDGVNWQLKQDD